MKTLNAAVIGCGSIARFHFPALEKAGVRVAWVCDLNAEAARPWAEKCGARVTTDFRDALADPALDLVDVTAIAPVHKPVCLAAIAAGKAVICEKTLAENAEDAWQIVSAARERGVVFYTSYMKRFIPAVAKARELLPQLGRILTTHIRAHQCWGDLWTENPASGHAHTPPGGRSGIAVKYAGGILPCGGSHILDLVLFLLGRPTRLHAVVHTPPGRDYDLLAAALMETPNGVVHFEALTHALRRIGAWRDGWDERFEITGVHGRLELYSPLWDRPDTHAAYLVHYDNRTAQAVEYRFAPVSPFERAVAFFCGNIARGQQGEQSPLTGYEVDELIEQFRRSAGLGRSVEIPWRDAPATPS